MVAGKGWYNGYSHQERSKKMGDHPPATGPCMLCGDPDVPVEYHSEDYSDPYDCRPPATYSLCRHCHRDKLHKRFNRPASAWLTFIAHIRRGGYASDLKEPEIKKELEAYRIAIERGEPFVLAQLRPYSGDVGSEWFANLRMDQESLTDPTARPRP